MVKKTRQCVICNMDELEENLYLKIKECYGICYPCSDELDRKWKS